MLSDNFVYYSSILLTMNFFIITIIISYPKILFEGTLKVLCIETVMYIVCAASVVMCHFSIKDSLVMCHFSIIDSVMMCHFSIKDSVVL